MTLFKYFQNIAGRRNLAGFAVATEHRAPSRPVATGLTSSRDGARRSNYNAAKNLHVIIGQCILTGRRRVAVFHTRLKPSEPSLNPLAGDGTLK